jgi:hypothetical protein
LQNGKSENCFLKVSKIKNLGSCEVLLKGMVSGFYITFTNVLDCSGYRKRANNKRKLASQHTLGHPKAKAALCKGKPTEIGAIQAVFAN